MLGYYLEPLIIDLISLYYGDEAKNIDPQTLLRYAKFISLAVSSISVVIMGLYYYVKLVVFRTFKTVKIIQVDKNRALSKYVRENCKWISKEELSIGTSSHIIIEYYPWSKVTINNHWVFLSACYNQETDEVNTTFYGYGIDSVIITEWINSINSNRYINLYVPEVNISDHEGVSVTMNCNETRSSMSEKNTFYNKTVQDNFAKPITKFLNGYDDYLKTGRQYKLNIMTYGTYGTGKSSSLYPLLRGYKIFKLSGLCFQSDEVFSKVIIKISDIANETDNPYAIIVDEGEKINYGISNGLMLQWLCGDLVNGRIIVFACNDLTFYNSLNGLNRPMRFDKVVEFGPIDLEQATNTNRVKELGYTEEFIASCVEEKWTITEFLSGMKVESESKDKVESGE